MNTGGDARLSLYFQLSYESGFRVSTVVSSRAVWGHAPLIPALRAEAGGSLQLEASLVYIVRYRSARARE